MSQQLNISLKQYDDLLTLINHVDCGFVKFLNDSTTTILYANDYFFHMLGYTQDEYLEKYIYHFIPCIHPEDSQKFKHILARQLAMGNSLYFEYRAFKKDGTLIWIRLQGQLYSDSSISYYCCSCLDITDSKVSYENLAKAKFELDTIANSLPGGVIKLSLPDYKLLYSNHGFYNLSGFSRTEYEQKYSNICLGVLHPDDIPFIKNKVKESIETKQMLSIEYRVIHKSGQIRWSYLNGNQIEIIDGKPIYLCIIVDITKQKEYESQLSIAQKTNQLLCEFTKETNWEYDISTGRLTRSGEVETTYSTERIIFDFVNKAKNEEIIHPNDLDAFKEAIQSMTEGRTTIKLELRLKNYLGVYCWYLIQGSMIFDSYGTAYRIIGKTSNIDIEKKKNSSLQDYNSTSVDLIQPAPFVQPNIPLAASHLFDSVTGLMNFSYFMESANNLIRHKGKKKIAVLSWDMNRFRKYNATYGFTLGNQILKLLSDAVLPHLKSGELFSRIHSDHFIMCIAFKNLAELTTRIATYRDDVILINEQCAPNVQIAISCGVYLVTKEDTQIASAIDKADIARKSVKKVPGLHNYVIYSQEMEQYEKEKLILSEAFIDALDNEEFTLTYQPVKNLKTELLYASEGLLRWQRPGNKHLLPKDFLFLLEQHTSTINLDFFVIEVACKQLCYWNNHGKKLLPIVLDILKAYQEPIDFCQYIDYITKKYQIDPSLFIFEFDEASFIEEPESLSYLTATLHKNGYKIMLCCSPKQYACLHYLKDYCIDIIKFNYTFLYDTINNPKECNFLKKMLSLLNELGIETSIINVDTKAQADLAKDIGFDMAVGSFYHDPLSIKDFTKYIL